MLFQKQLKWYFKQYFYSSFYFLLFGEEEAGEKEDAGWLRSGEKEKKYENNPK